MKDRRQSVNNNPGSLPLGELVRNLIASRGTIDEELLIDELDRREHEEYYGANTVILPVPSKTYKVLTTADIAEPFCTECQKTVTCVVRVADHWSCRVCLEKPLADLLAALRALP